MINETPQELQQLHEVLKQSPAAPYFVKIHWPEFAYRLSLESPAAKDGVHLLINIIVDAHNPGRFAYDALTNQLSSNEQAYERIEQRENVTTEEIIEMICRLLEPELRKALPIVEI